MKKFLYLFLFQNLFFHPVFANNHVVVQKEKRILNIVNRDGNIIKSFRISLGSSAQGHKNCEGDQKTPEGKYQLDYVNEKSAYYRSIHINYPNKEDIRSSKNQNCSPGGMIMIHGIKNYLGWMGLIHSFFDWTQGCIAIKNSEIDTLISMLKLPAQINIKP